MEAKAFVKSASQAEVVEKIEKGEAAVRRNERMQRTAREMALHSAQMGAEVAGSLLGGGVVGYLQANDYEEWGALLAVGLGAVAGMKRIEEPNNPYFQVAFAAANGIGAAIISGYARDYFSNNAPKATT